MRSYLYPKSATKCQDEVVWAAELCSEGFFIVGQTIQDVDEKRFANEIKRQKEQQSYETLPEILDLIGLQDRLEMWNDMRDNNSEPNSRDDW